MDGRDYQRGRSGEGTGVTKLEIGVFKLGTGVSKSERVAVNKRIGVTFHNCHNNMAITNQRVTFTSIHRSTVMPPSSCCRLSKIKKR